jgi:hypothetical protein
LFYNFSFVFFLFYDIKYYVIIFVIGKTLFLAVCVMNIMWQNGPGSHSQLLLSTYKALCNFTVSVEFHRYCDYHWYTAISRDSPALQQSTFRQKWAITTWQQPAVTNTLSTHTIIFTLPKLVTQLTATHAHLEPTSLHTTLTFQSYLRLRANNKHPTLLERELILLHVLSC